MSSADDMQRAIAESEARDGAFPESVAAEGYAVIDPPFDPERQADAGEAGASFRVRLPDGTTDSVRCTALRPRVKVFWESGNRSGAGIVALWSDVLPYAMNSMFGRGRWRLREYRPNRAPAQLGINPGPRLLSPGRHNT